MSRVCPCARSFKESSPCLGRTRSLFHVVSCISEEAHALNMKLDLSGDGGASYVILIYIYIYIYISFYIILRICAVPEEAVEERA